MNVRALEARFASLSPRTLLAGFVLAAFALGLAMSVEAAWEPYPVERAATTTRLVESGELTYRVPLVDPATGEATGERLAMGEAGYLATLAPRAELAFSWSRAEGAPSAVHATLAAVARSGEGWTLEVPLGDASVRNAPRLELTAILDLAALDRAVAEASETKGRPGPLSWSIVALVKHGEESGPSRYAWPFRYDAPLYVLHAPKDARDDRVTTERIVTTTEAEGGLGGLAREPWRAALAGFGLAGTAFILARRPEAAA
ncbi:MAG TPA: hypothetical protein VM889_00060 [Candidatus Thermoplasmatota archaeon]|nr:hypothetical protein [Candidatus Thermoplasmatota archaeon]